MAERIKQDGITWKWKRNPRLPKESLELIQLCDLLRSFQPSSLPDRWTSPIAPDGSFKVCDLRHKIDTLVTCAAQHRMVWLPAVPLKVNCFVWRAALDRIPTATALIRRGIPTPSPNCLLCHSELETTDHLLVSCPFSREVMSWILKWCDIPLQRFDSLAEVLDFASKWGRCPKKRKVFLSIIYGLLWCI